MKTLQNLEGGYMHLCSWHRNIKEFLEKTDGNYLEIGVYCGYFLAELGLMYPDKQIYGIDPYIADGHTGQPRGTILTDVEDICKRNIQDIGNITHFKKTTEDFLKTPTRKILRNITCVLVDGSHHYEDILIDINLLKKIPNKKKKLIVFDDLGIPDVSRGVDEFRAEFKDRNIIEFEPGQFYLDE